MVRLSRIDMARYLFRGDRHVARTLWTASDQRHMPPKGFLARWAEAFGQGNHRTASDGDAGAAKRRRFAASEASLKTLDWPR